MKHSKRFNLSLVPSSPIASKTSIDSVTRKIACIFAENRNVGTWNTDIPNDRKNSFFNLIVSRIEGAVAIIRFYSYRY